MIEFAIGVLILVCALAFWLMHRNKRRAIFDPDNAPPAFGPELPHDFKLYEDQTEGCCILCGGGKNHTVHHGVRYSPVANKSTAAQSWRGTDFGS